MGLSLRGTVHAEAVLNQMKDGVVLVPAVPRAKIHFQIYLQVQEQPQAGSSPVDQCKRVFVFIGLPCIYFDS